MKQILKTKTVFLGVLSVLALAVALWTLQPKPMVYASDYQIDRNYYIVVDANGSAYDILVNGISTKKETDVGATNFTTPINHLMQSGKNRVTFNYSPTELEYDADDKIIIGPHEHFHIHISIESIGLDTHERERITLVDARYDMETGQLISNEQTIHGTEPVYQQTLMHTSGELKLKGDQVWVLPSLAAPLPSQHLIAEFYTQDRFPRFHWLDEATVLEDTPELREGLRNAYRHIHDLMERGDFRGIRQLMDEGWQHAAITLNLGHTADDYIHSTEINKGYVKARDDGSILKPLHFDQLGTPLASDHIQFMADGRVVRLLPDPIQWQRPGARTTTFARFVFYVTEDGEWKVASIVSGG